MPSCSLLHMWSVTFVVLNLFFLKILSLYLVYSSLWHFLPIQPLILPFHFLSFRNQLKSPVHGLLPIPITYFLGDTCLLLFQWSHGGKQVPIGLLSCLKRGTYFTFHTVSSVLTKSILAEFWFKEVKSMWSMANMQSLRRNKQSSCHKIFLEACYYDQSNPLVFLFKETHDCRKMSYFKRKVLVSFLADPYKKHMLPCIVLDEAKNYRRDSQLSSLERYWRSSSSNPNP